MGTEKSFLEHLGEARLARKYLEATTGKEISPSVSLLTAGISYYEDKKKTEAASRSEPSPVHYRPSSPSVSAFRSDPQTSQQRADAILRHAEQCLDAIPRVAESIRNDIFGTKASLIPSDMRSLIDEFLHGAESLQLKLSDEILPEFRSNFERILEMQDGFKADREFINFLSSNSGFIVAQLKAAWGPKGFSDINDFTGECEQQCELLFGEGNALLEEAKGLRDGLYALQRKVQALEEFYREKRTRERIEALPFPLRWTCKMARWLANEYRNI